MTELLGYIGIGLMICMVIAPLSYCEIKRQESDAAIQKACIEAKGEWGAGWGRPYCKLPDPREKSDG